MATTPPRTSSRPWLPAFLPLLVAATVAGCLPTPSRDGPPRTTAATAVQPSRAEAQTVWPVSAKAYPWPRSEGGFEPLAARFPEPPKGFTRAQVKPGSWAQWLRHFPLRKAGTPVRALDKSIVVPANSPNLAAVVDMDVRKHQECADVILRLRAEFLRHAGREAEIAFPSGDGGRFSWPEWKQGSRPSYRSGRLSFSPAAAPDPSRASFDRFLASVFQWCGTYTLQSLGKPVKLAQIRPGDYLVHAGSPGHAALIADLARDPNGRLHALILQGYMPAQSPHVLAPDGSGPWFVLKPQAPLTVPFWGTFQWSELRRFGGEGD